jgi:hypothetical protein
MRNKVVTVNGKEINVQEKRIGELEKLIADLFPGSGGNVTKIDIAKFLEKADTNDLLYKKLPTMFPELTKEDVKNAYMSELEALLEAFIDVSFFGLKKAVKPLMGLIQTGLTQKQ